MPNHSFRSPKPIILDGLFLARPMSGVRLAGRELIRGILMNHDEAPVESRPQMHLLWPQDAPLTQMQDMFGFAAPSWLTVHTRAHSRPSEQLQHFHASRGKRSFHFCNSTPLIGGERVMWLHDAQAFDSPETYTRAFRLWVQANFTAARFDPRIAVATGSHFAKTRLVAHGVPEDRITVVLDGADHLQRHPVDPTAVEKNGLAGERFVLVTGSPAPHKNLPFAIEGLLASAAPEVKIAVIGLWQSGPYQASDRSWPKDRVRILPRLSDGALRAMYQAAELVVVPSLQEGFGLPAAEAMWEGAPLALSDRTSLPEVGGDAAVYFDPTDPRSFAQAITRAADPNVRAALKAHAVQRRSIFSWRRAAKDAADAFF